MPTTGRPRRPGLGPSGRAGKALEQGLGAGSKQPTRRDGKLDEGPRTRSQLEDHQAPFRARSAEA